MSLLWRFLRSGLAPYLCGAVLLGGAYAWHLRVVTRAVSAAERGLVQVADLAAAEAQLKEARRLLAAERRAGAVLATSAAGAEQEAARQRTLLNTYAQEHPDAPADCTVGPDLLRRLR